MKYQPDPPPLNADPVLGNYLHRELQKLSGLFQSDRINNLNISTYIEQLLDDIDAATARGTLDVPSNLALTTALSAYLPLASVPATLAPYELIANALVQTVGNWTPVLTANTGTITAYTATGKYIKTGRHVTITAEITVTNNGTGASFVTISGIPFAPENNTIAHSREVSITGLTGMGNLSGGTTAIQLTTYNNGYPVGTGQTIWVTATYRTAS